MYVIYRLQDNYNNQVCNAQQLTYNIELNIFVNYIQPKDYINKLIFLLKQRSNIARQRSKIIFIDNL